MREIASQHFRGKGADRTAQTVGLLLALNRKTEAVARSLNLTHSGSEGEQLCSSSLLKSQRIAVRARTAERWI